MDANFEKPMFVKVLDMMGMFVIAAISIISAAPKRKLKQVLVTPPYFVLGFLPQTPYKANSIAANKDKIIPAKLSFVFKGFMIQTIPIKTNIIAMMLFLLIFSRSIK